MATSIKLIIGLLPGNNLIHKTYPLVLLDKKKRKKLIIHDL